MVRANKPLLRRVLGLLRRTEDRIGNPKDRLLIAAYDGLIGGDLSATSALDQSRVRVVQRPFLRCETVP
jgi:hypothetical protein